MTDLRTFGLPDCVEGTDADLQLAHEVITAWQADGLVRIWIDRWQARRFEDAFEASRRFFTLPADLKSRCTSDLTYAGYSDTGATETMLICPDISLDDVRVGARWPCHGPVPWPSREYRRAMRTFMHELARIGDKLLHLTAIGLELPDFETLTTLAEDGWHHMLMQRFPLNTPGELSVHGMLVLAVQDGVLTASPGEIMEFLTNGKLTATPLEAVNGEGRHHVATYFHEPAFDIGLRPVLDTPGGYIHYGTHFTEVFRRREPDRPTSRRIIREDRLSVLASLSRRACVGS